MHGALIFWKSITTNQRAN